MIETSIVRDGNHFMYYSGQAMSRNSRQEGEAMMKIADSQAHLLREYKKISDSAGVYVVTDKTGRKIYYIGQSQRIRTRLAAHIRVGLRGCCANQTKFTRAIGASQNWRDWMCHIFTIDEIQSKFGFPIDSLIDAESEMIRHYEPRLNTTRSLGTRPGGLGSTRASVYRLMRLGKMFREGYL